MGLATTSTSVFLLSVFAGGWAAAPTFGVALRLALLALGGGVVVAGVLWGHDSSAGVHVRVRVARRSAQTASYLAGLLALSHVALNVPTSEVAAAGLVILLPLGATSVSWVDRRHRPHVWWRAALLGLGLVGLSLTGERSAWLALVVGCAAALVTHYWFARFGASARSVAALLVLGMAVSMVAALLILGRTDWGRGLLNASAYDRLYVWQDVLFVLSDYRYTGSGLGQTAMVLSTYVYLFHVPFIYQTYNLFLQIGFEQGIPGIIGFAGLSAAALLNILAAYRVGHSAMRWCCTVVLAALVTMLVHGMVDAGLYASKLVPLTFVPISMAMALPSSPSAEPSPAWFPWSWGSLAGASLPVIALCGLIFTPGAWAAWHANLGAVEQSRTELSVYSWPQWSIQDEVRRSIRVDLAGAVAHYETALRTNERNETAHRRLGQIALSLGDFGVARHHLRSANEAAPQRRVTQLLLGELYAVSGDVRQAVGVWRTGHTDLHKLELRQWWYTYLGATQQAAWLQEAVNQYQETQNGEP